VVASASSQAIIGDPTLVALGVAWMYTLWRRC
jgi:hypothetical protein